MHLIEPCCTQKHWPALRKKLGADGTQFFHGYGDLALDELLAVVLSHYTETDMMLVCPNLPDRAAELLLRWMRKSGARADGKGRLNIIARMTVITDLSDAKSPLASGWLTNNPYPERLTLHNIQQKDTALILPDLALYGALNIVHNSHFTAIASKNPKLIAQLRETYTEFTNRHRL